MQLLGSSIFEDADLITRWVTFAVIVILGHECFAQQQVRRGARAQTGSAPDQRCAANSLTACLLSLGVRTHSIDELDAICGRKGDQTSLADCAATARKLGLVAAGIAWRVPSQAKLSDAPAILPIALPGGRRHFVAAVGARHSELLIVDFPFNPKWVAWQSLREDWGWDGTMLHIARDQQELNDIVKVAEASQYSAKLSMFAGIALIVVFFVFGTKRCRTIKARRQMASVIIAQNQSRHGMSLIDLMVALGILSLLFALLLPAVQASREAARNAACKNNLRQVGVALGSFDASHGKLPAGSVLSGDRQGREVTRNLSPHVELLPWLDQQPLYALFDRSETGTGINDDPPASIVNDKLLTRTVSVFLCPSDPIDGPHCNYRISAGTSPWMHETTPRTASAALQGFRSLFGRRDAEFLDGKSNTAAFSEKLAGDQDRSRFTPWRDSISVTVLSPGLLTPDDALSACSRPADPEPKHYSFGGFTWVLSGYPQTWYNHVLPPNSRIPDCVDGSPMAHGAYSARSFHQNGVNTLFADGAVQFVGSGVDLRVWRAMGSINGGEPVSNE